MWCDFRGRWEVKITQEDSWDMRSSWNSKQLGGGFKYVFFSPLPVEMIQFDEYFSIGLKPPTRQALFDGWKRWLPTIFPCKELVRHPIDSQPFLKWMAIISWFDRFQLQFAKKSNFWMQTNLDLRTTIKANESTHEQWSFHPAWLGYIRDELFLASYIGIIS